MNARNLAAKINKKGLDLFAKGDPVQASTLIRQAYQLLPEEPGILVNLGLALMQMGLPNHSERAYRLVIEQPNSSIQALRSACKNLGFLKLWQGKFKEGWYWHGKRFDKEPFLTNQWKGDPLDGEQLTVWNDVGMGDAFQFVRYLKPLIENGENIRFAVDKSQIKLFRKNLCWPITSVVNRDEIDRSACIHIPLMSLIALVDPLTTWGRSFLGPTFKSHHQEKPASNTQQIGICWASNPTDKTMHIYKSRTPERLIQLIKEQKKHIPIKLVSLQADEELAHERLKIRPAIKDWQDTLTRINQCDEIWSVDTAIAHLASGLGKPVQMTLNIPPDWRWRRFSNREKELNQIWYPTLSIIDNNQTG